MHIFTHNGRIHRIHSETHTCGIQVGFLLEKVCMLLKNPEITSQSFRHCKYIVNI